MKASKVLLWILLVLQAIVGGILAIAILPQSLILSLVCLFIYVLQITLTGVVIYHCSELDDVWFEINRLRLAIRVLQKASDSDNEMVYLAENSGELAHNTWECVKCCTVNKEDTTNCSHCGAAYSADVYPTDDSSKKRKMSRWIKEDKKRSLFRSKANS